MEIRKVALRLLIASIVVSGVFAIAALVSGEFGRLQARVLLSALATSGASICGMACGAAWDRVRWQGLARTGIAMTVLTLALTLFAIWVEPEPIETWMRWVATGWFFSIATAHGCLLALARTDRTLARVRIVSLLLGFLLAAGISLPVWEAPFAQNDDYFRGLGVIAVLMLMGSLSLPVVAKLRSLPEPAAAEDASTTLQTQVMCPACGHVQSAALGAVHCAGCGARYRIELDRESA